MFDPCDLRKADGMSAQSHADPNDATFPAGRLNRAGHFHAASRLFDGVIAISNTDLVRRVGTVMLGLLPVNEALHKSSGRGSNITSNPSLLKLPTWSFNWIAKSDEFI